MIQRPTLPGISCNEVRRRLELYLDGMLEPIEDHAVHAHLLVCGSCRAEAAVADAVETGLRSAVHADAPPQELWSRIAADLRAQGSDVARLERQPRVVRMSRRAALAATALAAVGIVFAGRRLTTTGIDAVELMQTPVNELRSFVDSGRPVDFATADPAELRQWFAPRVEFAPPTPPAKAGLTLIGGRLCYFFRRRIAAYMYQSGGHILSLYVMADDDIEPPSDNPGVMLDGRWAAVREVNGFAHVLWNDGRLYYSLVSEQPASRVTDVARAIVTPTG